jgi:hypothetical protein
MEDLKCPIMDKPCCKTACAWFFPLDNMGHCAVKRLALQLEKKLEKQKV